MVCIQFTPLKGFFLGGGQRRYADRRVLRLVQLAKWLDEGKG